MKSRSTETERVISRRPAGRFLSSQPWDFVTLQQASHFSADKGTYQPYLMTLAEYVRQYAPGAELVIHETWAYEEGSQRLTEELGFANQREMYDQLEAAYEQAATDLGGASIIPCGYAFQYALAQGFSNLHRDTFHASIPQGRYLLAAVWYEFLRGRLWWAMHFVQKGCRCGNRNFCSDVPMRRGLNGNRTIRRTPVSRAKWLCE
ncbi:MAG: DUF4886 domain-containing protein [Clostridia bacterium]